MWIGLVVVILLATIVLSAKDRLDLASYGFVTAMMGVLITGNYVVEVNSNYKLGKEAQQIKKECEIFLPRDKFCEIVVTAKPKEE